MPGLPSASTPTARRSWTRRCASCSATAGSRIARSVVAGLRAVSADPRPPAIRGWSTLVGELSAGERHVPAPLGAPRRPAARRQGHERPASPPGRAAWSSAGRSSRSAGSPGQTLVIHQPEPGSASRAGARPAARASAAGARQRRRCPNRPDARPSPPPLDPDPVRRRTTHARPCSSPEAPASSACTRRPAARAAATTSARRSARSPASPMSARRWRRRRRRRPPRVLRRRPLADDGWAEAVDGCDVRPARRLAVPPGRPTEDELIVPAREGTLRVLRAARDAGVRRVVVTSSFAAIGYGRAAPVDHVVHRGRLDRPERGHRRLRRVQDARRARRLGLRRASAARWSSRSSTRSASSARCSGPTAPLDRAGLAACSTARWPPACRASPSRSSTSATPPTCTCAR